MRGAFVKQEILDTQMSVVRNEMESGENSPARILSERVRATAYLWHNYGKSTIGARSDVEHVPIERLQAFYNRYYHPNNAVLIIAGKFETPRVLGLVAAKFGPIPRSPQPIPETYTREPTQDGERAVTLRRAGDTQAVLAAYHVPSGLHSDTGPLRVLVDTLVGQPNGRLYKALVETKKATSVSGGSNAFREGGLLTITAGLRKEQSLDDVRDAVLRALDALASNPPSVEEVERSRAKLVRSTELTLANSNAVGSALVEAVATGDWRVVFLQRDWLRATTVADVARVAKAYLVPANRTLGVFIPEEKPLRAEIPAAPDIAALVKNYQGDQAVAQGEAFDPTPENIEQRTVRVTLPGGIKAALLAKKTRGEIVDASLSLHFGTLATMTGKRTVANAAGDLLIRGSLKRDRQQISDELTRLKSQLGINGNAGGVSMALRTTRANLPALLKLAVEILREPAFAADEFARWQQQQLAAWEAAASDPTALAQQALQRHLRPYPAEDPRGVALIPEAIAALQALTIDHVKTFWREYAGASDGELVVVGDFDAAEIRQLAGDLLGAWKSPQPHREWSRDYAEIEPLNRAIETPDKANAFFVAGAPIRVTDEHPDYPALLLGNYMLGGHSASRLYLRIRAKEGLSYSVSSQFGASPRDGLATFGASAIANPPNITKVEAAFKDEIARVLREGFAADEVATAKNGFLQSRKVQRSSDTAIVGMWSGYLRAGRTMAHGAELDKKIGALTAEEVTAAWRRHFDPAQISIVKAGDFKKAVAAP
jgi:zinc protease